jgi:hypothetical protein
MSEPAIVHRSFTAIWPKVSRSLCTIEHKVKKIFRMTPLAMLKYEQMMFTLSTSGHSRAHSYAVKMHSITNNEARVAVATPSDDRLTHSTAK